MNIWVSQDSMPLWFHFYPLFWFLSSQSTLLRRNLTIHYCWGLDILGNGEDDVESINWKVDFIWPTWVRDAHRGNFVQQRAGTVANMAANLLLYIQGCMSSRYLTLPCQSLFFTHVCCGFSLADTFQMLVLFSTNSLSSFFILLCFSPWDLWHHLSTLRLLRFKLELRIGNK